MARGAGDFCYSCRPDIVRRFLGLAENLICFYSLTITAIFNKANVDVLRLLRRHSSNDISQRRYVRRAKDRRVLNPLPENYGTIPPIASAE
jgi:hypothetical protein